MTAQEVIELVGHRDVPPWVMKLVADCVAKERQDILQLSSQNWYKTQKDFEEAIRARGNND